MPKKGHRTKSPPVTGAEAPQTPASSADKAPPQGFDQAGDGFHIVGIGASAGGLEAFRQFFQHMPSDSGMAFVLVQHLDPSHESLLSELIGRCTAMTVAEAEDGVPVRPDHVYTIPPNRDMAILGGKLQLLEPNASPEAARLRGLRTPIDFFFRSLADDHGRWAVGIVLSGSGTEGALGIKAIKEAAGLVVVQDPESAEYDSMPRSSLATGLADIVLAPAQMPERLLAWARHPGRPLPVPEPGNQLDKICLALRNSTGHDFSRYKPNTLLRRIYRRLALHQLDDLSSYLRFLHENPPEVDVLFQELLIAVTRFFRDPEAFDRLAELAIRPLLEDRPANLPVRVWVPGCATGEEAYSIAILLRECMDECGTSWPVEIFGTDLDDNAIEAARRGAYPETIAADVSAERLRRHFAHEGQTFHIGKELRSWLVFAEQSLIKDPPFSRIDLVSCRNLLIYLQSDLQRRVLPLFHFALRPGGYLLLGNSESISEATDLFEPLDRKWKLFRRQETSTAPRGFTFHPPGPAPAGARRHETTMKVPKVGYRQMTEKSLLEHHGSSAILVDGRDEVLYIHGRTGRYLEPAQGEARWNVLDMAREGLRLTLSAALRQAHAQHKVVRRERLPVQDNGGRVLIDLTVRPLPKGSAASGLTLIVIEPSAETELEGASAPAGQTSPEGPRINELEKDLQATREHLQTTIEELETSNEELRSSNEELQSTNEELQSANEELETSREEQQSVNEELATVNAELQNKVEQLSHAQNDMQNLLASTEVGTVFLDPDLKIQRFTPPITGLLNLIDTDLGRPISHIATNLDYPRLITDAEDVLGDLIPREREVESEDGAWYRVRIGPYRTTEDVIDGLVITFIDVSEARRVQEELRRSEQEQAAARRYAQAIVDTVPEPLIVLGGDLRVQSVNQSYYRVFGTVPEETLGKLVFELSTRQWDVPELRQRLEAALHDGKSSSDFEVERLFDRIGGRRMRLDVRRIEGEAGEASQLILLSLENVSSVASDH